MMDTIGQAAVVILLLVLPISALASRGLSSAVIAKYVGAWVLVFVILWLIAMKFT